MSIYKLGLICAVVVLFAMLRGNNSDVVAACEAQEVMSTSACILEATR